MSWLNLSIPSLLFAGSGMLALAATAAKTISPITDSGSPNHACPSQRPDKTWAGGMDRVCSLEAGQRTYVTSIAKVLAHNSSAPTGDGPDPQSPTESGQRRTPQEAREAEREARRVAVRSAEFRALLREL